MGVLNIKALKEVQKKVKETAKAYTTKVVKSECKTCGKK